MKRWYRNLSLTWKVGIVLGLSMVGTLVLSAGALLIFETVTFSARGERQLDGLAGSLSVTLQAPVDFRDAAEAVRTLHALEGLPDIVETHVYLADGTPFASYWRGRATGVVPALRAPGATREGPELVVVRPLTRGADVYGTLLVRSDLGSERAHFRQSMLLLGALALVALLAAMGLTVVLQRFIARPVLELAATARRITESNDFSVRAPLHTGDEIGTLAGSLNHMLEVLGRNEAELRASEERLRFALQAARMGTWSLEIATNRFRASEELKSIYGFPAGTVIETLGDFLALMPEAERKQVIESTAAALAAPTEDHLIERPITHRDGSIRWIELRGRVHRGPDEKPIHMAGTVADITERKRSEHDLVLSEGRFRRIMESDMIGMYFAKTTGEIKQANNAFLRIVGYTQEDVRAGRLHWGKMTPPDLRTNDEFALKQLTATGACTPYEKEYFRKDGSRVPILLGAAILPQQPDEGVAFVIDLTHSKQADAALRASEERYQLVERAVDDGVWDWNILTNEAYLAPRWKAILGYTEAEMPNAVSSFYSSIHPDDVTATHEAIRRHLEGKVRYAIEVRLRHKDGSYRWVLTRGEAIRDAADRPVRMVGAITDITARKLADATLRESEERMAGIVESAMDAIVSVDHLQRIVLFNTAAERMFGYRATDMLGQSLERLIPPRYRPGHQQHIETFSHAGITTRAMGELGQINGLRASGEEFPIEASISQIGTGDKKLLTVILRDMTTRQQAEAERRALENQLRQSQKMEAVGTLAGGIAHDFNNILSGIYGYTALARTASAGNTAVLDYLDEIGRAGRRAADLVKQILTFSRTDDQTLVPLQLRDVVGEAVKLLRASLPATIEITTQLPPNLPSVLGNAAQFHQIVMNLGTNAAHAMAEGSGTLRISLDTCIMNEARTHELPGLQPGRCVRLSVSDTGCGMDAATQQRVFEPFFTTKAPGEGTGLGLAVVHGIVRIHHGAVRLTSEPGRGSTFEIYLPASDSTPKTDPAGPEQPLRGHGEHILIVDDEAMIARATEITLRHLGYIPASETRVLVALERLERDPHAFQLVITDQTMPGLSGLEFAKRIHALRADLPVVIASGYSTTLTPERIAAAGVREILPKPFSVVTLAAIVHRHLYPSPP